MTKKHLTPQGMTLVATIFEFIVLLYVLIPVYQTTVFLLLLLLLLSLVIRWRIKIDPHFMLIDQTFFMIVVFFNPSFLGFLFIFAFYYAYVNRLYLSLPILGLFVFLTKSPFDYIQFLQATLIGFLLYHWEKEHQKNEMTNDHFRRRIYELESNQAQLLADVQATERISQLNERQRIAEILHDSLGHELTAAHLSLIAYKTLRDNGLVERAEKTLTKTKKRLEGALIELKETVKRIEPTEPYGLSNLNTLLTNFVYPVDFSHEGDLTRIKSYMWQLILMTIKEGLTNITKHAQPKGVHVSIEVTDYIVRLVIENDGVQMTKKTSSGNGLRYIRQRLEAVNGSLSVQKGEIFKLIIIIPLNN